jgi:hypothetical protein
MVGRGAGRVLRCWETAGVLPTFTPPSFRDAALLDRRRELASYSELESEFGLSAARISSILTKYMPQDERKRIERETRRRAQDRRNTGLRDELLTDLPPCGSPQCGDPACGVQPWLCHHCRERSVNPAPQTHREQHTGEQHTVKDRPLMYCSRRCRGLASTNRPAAAMARAEAKRERVVEMLAELGRDGHR